MKDLIERLREHLRSHPGDKKADKVLTALELLERADPRTRNMHLERIARDFAEEILRRVS